MKTLRAKRWIPSIILVLLLISLFPLQLKIESERKALDTKEELLYLPSGKVLKVASLGFDEVASDIIYIKMLSYFATHLMTDRTYKWLYHMADLVTTLDPYFRFTYIFAGLILNLEAGQFENARAILLKGRQYFPNDWYFPFALGLNYFFNQADLITAAYYFDLASSLPNSPPYLKGFAIKLREKGKTKETTLEFLYFLYEIFPMPEIREILWERITELNAGS
jgi:hypothetical protein